MKKIIIVDVPEGFSIKEKGILLSRDDNSDFIYPTFTKPRPITEWIKAAQCPLCDGSGIIIDDEDCGAIHPCSWCKEKEIILKQLGL